MSLGQLLRDRRIELGKSIEQISAATRIHVRILSALEEDRYADLPARTFTRGFIASYCKALRLDPDQVFRDHHDFLEQKFTERQDRDQGHQGYVFEGKELEQNKRGMIIGATAAICFAVAVLLLFKPQNHKRKEKHKDFVAEDAAATNNGEESESDEIIITNPSQSSNKSATSPTPVVSPSPSPTATEEGAAAITAASPTEAATPTPSPAPTAKPTVTPTPTPTPTARPSASPSPAAEEIKKDPLNKGDDLGPQEYKKKISFEALEDAFVKYRADDRPETQFTLRKGKFLVIKAKETIVFETNKPEALQYRTKTRTYDPLPFPRFSVSSDGTLSEP